MSSANWWADRLGTQRPASQPQQPSQAYPPTYNPNQAPVPPNPYMPGQVQQMPGQFVNPQGMPVQQPGGWQTNATPDSWKTDTTCPSCRSQNYATVGRIASQNGTVEAKRCYDCGYPITQSGSGMASVGQSAMAGPTKPAIQVPTGGFNPNVIIGHI